MSVYSPLFISLVAAFIIFPAITESACIPENRFIDNHNATVTDIDSGLIWMRCSLGQTWDQPRCNGIAVSLTWNAAYDVAKKLNKKAYGHVTDWRVPTLRELATLIERQCTQPRINPGLFPDTPAARFWSATSKRDTLDQAYFLSFGREGVGASVKNTPHFVRLVSGRN